MTAKIHKIINKNKLMMPNNLECHSRANHIIGNADWKFVTCKNCINQKPNTREIGFD